MGREKKRYSFHDSYFQDHAKKIVLGMDGNPRVEYVYEGIYYSLEGTNKSWFLKKFVYLLISAVAVVVFLYAMMADTALNRKSDVLILQVISLFLFLGLIVGMVNRLTAPRHMTKWEYRMSVATLKEFSLLLVWSIGGILLDGSLSISFERIVWDSASAVFLGETLVCLLILLFQYRLIKRERYRQKISEDLPSGTDITNDFSPLP